MQEIQERINLRTGGTEIIMTELCVHEVAKLFIPRQYTHLPFSLLP